MQGRFFRWAASEGWSGGWQTLSNRLTIWSVNCGKRGKQAGASRWPSAAKDMASGSCRVFDSTGDNRQVLLEQTSCAGVQAIAHETLAKIAVAMPCAILTLPNPHRT